MSIVKAFRFPASVQWRGDRLTRASAPGKLTLDVATPPEFKGGVAGVWSPEELLVAAVASSFTVTLAAVADRSAVDLSTIDVDALGHVEPTADGRFGFTLIELTVEVEAREHPHVIERLVADAERLCPVTLALDVPVHVRLVAAEAVGVAISG